MDGYEIENSLDPLDPDTDEVGIIDGDGQPLGLDPLNPDSDGDGLLDGEDPEFNEPTTSSEEVIFVPLISIITLLGSFAMAKEKLR